MRKWMPVLIAASLLLAILAVVLVLQVAGRPGRAFRLEVSGTEGRKVVGLVTVDGVSKRLDGALPVRWDFQGRSIRFAIAPVDGKSDEPIAVLLSFDEKPWGSCTSPGVQGQVERWGIAFMGGKGGHLGGMSAAEVAELTK